MVISRSWAWPDIFYNYTWQDLATKLNAPVVSDLPDGWRYAWREHLLCAATESLLGSWIDDEPPRFAESWARCFDGKRDADGGSAARACMYDVNEWTYDG